MWQPHPRREEVLPYIGYYLDDAAKDMPPNARLIGWQCGFEPMFVAVWSYLGVTLDDDEAVDLATDLLAERDWFGGRGAAEPDYIL